MIDKYGVGTIHKTNQGYNIKIINREKVGHSLVKFLDKYGYEVVVQNSNILSGSVRNPFHTSVCGIGCIGVGKYKVSTNGKSTREYETWRSMLVRCYDSKYQKISPNYIGITVCEEWLNFQNFAEWHEKNYPKIEGIKFELDKDLLQLDKDTKIYSSETCLFLPTRINLFIMKNYSRNTSGYIGVSWSKSHKKWKCNISNFNSGEYIYLGLFEDIHEASNQYKNAKIKQSEYAKEYLRKLNYLPEEIIQLIK